MQEVWAGIEGWPNYAVSNFGYVLNRTTNKILRGRPNDRGYLRVRLWSNGGQKEFYVAQLVAQAFFGDWQDGLRVTHNDGDLTNNALWNLRLRRGIVGMHYESRKAFTGKPVRVIETGQEFRTVKDAATYLGGDFSTIYKVLRGQRDTHMGFHYEYVEGDD